MDNTDNPSNPEAERVQGSPDNGQPPNPSSSHIQTHVHSGIVDSLVDLQEAVLRLGVELTALSNELGEDRSDFLGISGINPDQTNAIGGEELESTTNRIHDFHRNIHGQVAQLSETARFWLEQDPEETAFLPPEVPPGSPETTSTELGGPSFVPPRHPLVEAPQLLLGGPYNRPPLPELAHLNSSDLLHAHIHHEYNGMPSLLSVSESSDDEEADLSEYRARFQAAGGSTRNPPEDPINDGHGMPGLMYISESSDDEGAPTDGETSSDDSGRHAEGVLEESARPTRSEPLLARLNPPRVQRLPYTRDPWVVPGSGMHQLLMQGRAPGDTSPPSLIAPEAGQTPQSLETREPHTGDAAWRSSRMQKLLSSLEVLDESMLDRFCRVGGGGGEHNDQCMICWESLKVEPIGDRSWTAIGSTSSEENGHASTLAGNLNATPRTSTSLTVPSDGSGAAALPCLHVFHFKCLVPWFDKLATTCPVCRFDLDPNKLLLFPVSVASILQRQAARHLLTREWASEDPLFHQAVVAQEEFRSRIGRSPPRRGAQSSTTSPMQIIGGDDSSWSSTEFSTEDSIPSLHSIPAQQNDPDIAEDTPSEHSSGDSMPPLSEPLVNGASDLAERNPPTVETLATITPLDPASNGASNPSGINHGSSDEEHSTAPPTGADSTGTRESTVLEEVDAEDLVHSASDISTDSMPSLIAASEELDPLSSSPNRGRNSRAAREESRGDSAGVVDQNRERYRNRSTASQAASTTGNPQEATFRDYAAETRTFLTEMQDTLLNAYVRFSNIRTETTTDVDALQTQANRWASLTRNREVASIPPPSATSGIPTMIFIDRPPPWTSSQDAARREWVLPKGPVEGGVVNWVNKREAEIRGDLESRPS